MSTTSRATGDRALAPPLKWPGGKRWLIPHLQMVWGEYKGLRLVEPFCGGLAVALGLQPARALLNDANVHAINFYRWLQRGLTPDNTMRNEQEFFYRCRARFNELVGCAKGSQSREAAELFYYLNRTAFNGLCRFNRSGQFNVPFGRYRTIRYQPDFRAYSPLLSRWRFTHGDFAAVDVQSGDFLYADPPYDQGFTSYSKDPFEWDDQVRLARWLAEHDGPVVASNRATERIVELYRSLGFAIQQFSAPRRISCNGDRRPATEIVATRLP